MPERKMLQVFDNDYLFVEKMRIAKREKFANMKQYPNIDITFSKTQFSKSLYETDPFNEDFDGAAHLKYQHINNNRPQSKEQRLKGKIMANNSYKSSLAEIYN
jgi:hypothetical protein